MLPVKNGQEIPAAPIMNPPQNGPSTLARLEKDWETPSIVPCCPVPANFEMRLVSDGETNALPIERSVMRTMRSETE